MRKTNRKIAMAVVLTLCITLLAGTITVRASANDEVLLSSMAYTERMEKIHWVADALRSLGFDNGSNLQKQALKQCGDYWHEQNALRKKAIEAEKPKMELWANCEITAYEWTGQPCADGRHPEVGYTAANNVLPSGTKIYIEGIGYRTVHDTGATWHRSNWVDVYMGDKATCDAFGRQWRNVYIIK